MRFFLHQANDRDHLMIVSMSKSTSVTGLPEHHRGIYLNLQYDPHEQVEAAKKKDMREKRRGIGFETVAGMGGVL